MNYLLDTNIVSLALKQNALILEKIELAQAKEDNIRTYANGNESRGNS